MKKMIATIAAAAGIFAAAAATENANPHTTAEIAAEARKVASAELEKTATELAAQARREMPAQWERSAEAEARRKASHRKAILADELFARAAAEKKSAKTGKKANN